MKKIILILSLFIGGVYANNFDGNSFDDIVFDYKNGKDKRYIWLFNNSGKTIKGFNYPIDWSLKDFADMNDDNITDIIWKNDNGRYIVRLMNENIVLSSVGLSALSEWELEATGDFNGDGYEDTIFKKEDGKRIIVPLDKTKKLGIGGQSSWDIKGVGDFNSDGYDDILWDRNNGKNYLLWFMGENGKSSQSAIATPKDWNFKGIGDFNGDGNADIIWEKFAGRYALRFMDGNNISQTITIGTPTSFTFEQIGDFNGDGNDDILFKKDNGRRIVKFLDQTGIIGQNQIGGQDIWNIEPFVFKEKTVPDTPLSENWYFRVVPRAVLDEKIYIHRTAGIFGELLDSNNEKDRHDIKSMGNAIIQVVFPQTNWGEYNGDYFSDYRALNPSNEKRVWTFQVKNQEEVNLANAKLIIDFEGPYDIEVIPKDGYNLFNEKVSRNKSKKNSINIIDIDNQIAYTYKEFKNANLSMDGLHTRTFKVVVGEVTNEDYAIEEAPELLSNEQTIRKNNNCNDKFGCPPSL